MWSNHKVKEYRTSYAALTHWTIIETIVQSAAIYSAALISLLATYVAHSNAQYICIDALNPVIVRPFPFPFPSPFTFLFPRFEFLLCELS